MRQRAAALLKLLGADSAEAPAGAPRGAQPSSVADLMGGMDEPDSAPAPAARSDHMGEQLFVVLPSCLQLSSDALGPGSVCPVMTGQLWLRSIILACSHRGRSSALWPDIGRVIYTSLMAPTTEALKTHKSDRQLWKVFLSVYSDEIQPVAGDLLAGGDASQAPVQHTGGLLDELAGPASTPSAAFAHSNGTAGAAAGKPEASSGQGAADMFGGLSLGGKIGIQASFLNQAGVSIKSVKAAGLCAVTSVSETWCTST